MSSEIVKQDNAQGISPVYWRVVSDESPADGHATFEEQLQAEFDRGRQQGASEAVDTARREAEARLQPVLDRLVRSLAELTVTRQRLREATTADLVRLAIAIAERILHREITTDAASIEAIARAALEKVQSRDVARVVTHPTHEAAIRRLLEQAAPGKPVEVVADASLQCGDVRFETGQGVLDASIQTQILEIERGLAGWLAPGSTHTPEHD